MVKTSLRAFVIALLAVFAIYRANVGSAAAFDAFRSLATLLASDRRARIEISAASVPQSVSIADRSRIVLKVAKACASAA